MHFVAKCFDVAESDGCDVLRVGMGYERHIRLPRGRVYIMNKLSEDARVPTDSEKLENR